MGDRLGQLEKKKIIIKNALQIIHHIENIKYPRWSEFINRKIDTFISTIWQLYSLNDAEMVREMMYKIVELEIIRDNPNFALGIEDLSLYEAVKETKFKHIRLVKVDKNKHKINAIFEIVNPKEKKYNSKEEARRNQIGGSEYHISFTPNVKKYNKIVAIHYNNTIEKKDVISLVAASMYFTNFSDDIIKTTLEKHFLYTGEIPSFNNLKYVAIVWGNENHFIDNQNQATLSIPCSEMPFNNDSGIYNIFFSRGRSGEKDVVQYSDAYFEKIEYDNFSQIYSATFNGGDHYPYEIDNYYAIFA